MYKSHIHFKELVFNNILLHYKNTEYLTYLLKNNFLLQQFEQWTKSNAAMKNINYSKSNTEINVRILTDEKNIQIGIPISKQQ